MPSGQLTQVAYDGIAAQFGADAATLAAYGGVDSITALKQQIDQYDKLAAQARQAGDEQAAAAFAGQANSLSDALDSASAALAKSIAFNQTNDPKIAAYLTQQAQAAGIIGAAGSSVVRSQRGRAAAASLRRRDGCAAKRRADGKGKVYAFVRRSRCMPTSAQFFQRPIAGSIWMTRDDAFVSPGAAIPFPVALR